MAKDREGRRSRAAKLAAAAQSLKQASGGDGAAFCLAFMTDSARAPNPELVARTLPKRSAVILRDYDAPNRSALARRLRAITAQRDVLLIIGADEPLARSVGADGVHIPSWSENKSMVKTGLIVTTACHSAGDLVRAAAVGADLALLSPVFPTGSHPGAPVLGADRFKALAAAAPLPVIALGGITETNASSLRGTNVVGLAAISAFL